MRLMHVDANKAFAHPESRYEQSAPFVLAICGGTTGKAFYLEQILGLLHFL